MIIEVRNLKHLPSDHDISGHKPEGEEAYLVVGDGTIDEGLVGRLCNTTLTPLVSSGNSRIYSVRVRGYRLSVFVCIVTAFANEEFEKAERLIKEETPQDPIWE